MGHLSWSRWIQCYNHVDLGPKSQSAKTQKTKAVHVADQLMGLWRAMCLGKEGVHMCSGANLELSLEHSEGRARGLPPRAPRHSPPGRRGEETGLRAGNEAEAGRGRSGSQGAVSEAGAPSDSELPGQGGALLVGQLLHVQGHGARLIAKLVVLRDVHVTFRVPCVIGHPDCDRGTCDGHLRATVDGQGGEKEREETHAHESGFRSPRSTGCPGASPGGHEEWACTREGVLAGRGPQTACPRGLCAVEGG